MKPIFEVHAPCKELNIYINIKWGTLTVDHYTGPSRGTQKGPSQNIVRLAVIPESLA